MLMTVRYKTVTLTRRFCQGAFGKIVHWAILVYFDTKEGWVVKLSNANVVIFGKLAC